MRYTYSSNLIYTAQIRDPVVDTELRTDGFHITAAFQCHRSTVILLAIPNVGMP